MRQAKISSKIFSFAKSAIAAGVLPLFFIYVMIAKPDYRIMNMFAHVVLPVAHTVGDIVTWPVRVGGRTIASVRDMARLRDENEQLRAMLDAALARTSGCEIAVAENKKLAREIGIANQTPQQTVIADVVHDNRAIGHNTFMITRGTNDGVRNGMAVVSFDGRLVGVVMDAGAKFARVRALTDANSNIAVRVAGADVYGFLGGNGSSTPTIGFFSDPQFQPAPNIKLVTSNISGVLPAGLYVGQMRNGVDVDVLGGGGVSRVMVLKFDDTDGYK